MDDFDCYDFRSTGIIQFTPQSEKILDIGIGVSDAKGGTAFSEIKIICISRSDIDGDLIYDFLDNCPEDYNPGQANADKDGIGDSCDLCPNDANNDIDSDEVCDDVDNCPDTFNPDQTDTNGNNIGDVCDDTPDTPDNDNNNGKAYSPFYQFWSQMSNLFGFMPHVFSGYRPIIKTDQFYDNIQMPCLIPYPGSYGIHCYWSIPEQNPIMNYSYSETLSRNDFLSNHPPEDFFIYPFWIFPVTQYHIQY